MASISVIVPTFNRAHLLARCLDSILAQTCPADEVIVVDDGSTDATVQLIRDHYPTVHYLYQDNRGVSAARNIGIRSARGDWLALLDSDDEWLPQKLERQAAALQQQPGYLIAHSNETWLYNGRPKYQKRKHRKYGGHVFQYCLPLCAISPSSVIIHRSLFDDIGLFDESLPACEDYDMWLRISAMYPVLLVDEPLIIKHGGHAGQLSQEYPAMDRFRITAINKVLESGILSEADRTAAIKTMKEKIQIYLNGARKHNNNELVSEFEQLSLQHLN